MTELEARAIEIREVRENSRQVDFVASSETMDAHETVVRQRWRLDRFQKNPVVLYAHESRELPIGRATNLRVERKQLIATVEFAPAEVNPRAEQVWQGVTKGFICGASVGFYPHKVSEEEVDGRPVLVLDDNELLELSITPIPSNPDTLARLRSRALATGSTKDDATDPPSPETPAVERGEQERTMSDQNTDTAALKSKLAEREAEIRVVEKSLADLKAERDILAGQNKALVTERDAFKARAEKAEGELVEREVDALVGVKITPAEKPSFVKLARSNRELFAEMVAQRSDLGMKPGSGSVLPSDPAEQKRAPATTDDHDKTFGDFMKSLGN